MNSKRIVKACTWIFHDYSKPVNDLFNKYQTKCEWKSLETHFCQICFERQVHNISNDRAHSAQGRATRLGLIHGFIYICDHALATHTLITLITIMIESSEEAPVSQYRNAWPAEWWWQKYWLLIFGGRTEKQYFLGPRGPLRTPLVSRCPLSVVRAKNSRNLSFSFPSDSKLKQPLPQYTEHWTGSIRGPF